ncbi:MAG: CehA/McbA family metallohydrolase [Spirochaetaceae bacterium]|nr:CehA/McbA family metallohydrolase [Spirochaetaceae bacterium]
MQGRTERTFRGTLSAADVKRHIPHAFHVPEGATRVEATLGFDPAIVSGHRNMICLSLYDPRTFRGARHRHGNRHTAVICHDSATPGFLPGSLPAGDWVVQLETHMVMPGTACTYRIAVAIDHGAGPPAAAETPPAPRFDRVADHRSGWYLGDLHAHTVHSDGAWEVADLVAAARARGLDFVTLTDHNTTGGLAEMARCGGPGLLTMGGQELTTYWGHALCLGSRSWQDWRGLTREGPEMAALAEAIYAGGGLYVIAHPRTAGDPHCTGCRWLYTWMMPGTAKLVEVWNGDWFGRGDDLRDRNEAALRLWYGWLNRGHRLVATAGTDVHGPDRQYRSPDAGFNAVHADRLSESAILQGVAAGHVYLTAGPSLRFAAHHQSGARGMMGDSLPAPGGSASVSLAASWDGVPESASLRLIAGGQARDTLSIPASGTRTWTVSAAPADADWYVVEVRGRDGAMLALSNPIFLDR